MKITYYFEVLSSWCYWVEPTWAELRRRFAGRVEFQWKIALMNPGDFPASRAQCDWFYRRSGTIVRSPFMLNSGWFEAGRNGDYPAPNLVAEAARTLGIDDDRARLALSHAALREGVTVGDLDLAVDVVAKACSLDRGVLKARAQAAETLQRVRTTTAEFHALQITQRPAFLLEDAIGDRAVFSGLIAVEAFVPTIDAMLADTAAYAAHAAHWGKPPSA